LKCGFEFYNHLKKGYFMAPNREKTLEILRNIYPQLNERFGVTKIGIFGSVARDEATEKSEVNIVYEMGKQNELTVAHFKAKLEKALNSSVELARLRPRMNPSLKKKIEDEGIYV
jgi:uncharacterized protein